MNGRPAPFLVFPWQQPFLPALVSHILAPDTTDARDGTRADGRSPHGAAQDTVLIVPHERPWRYLVRIFGERGVPALLPRTLSFSALVGLWRPYASTGAVRRATGLDSAALLRRCVQELGAEDEALSARFAHMDMAQFLPWGLKLASLLEELFIQNIEPADMAHAEGEVSPPAAALLGALGRISRAWRATLAEGGWTTPGLDQYLAAQAADTIPPTLRPGPGRRVIIAGFSTLSATEETLLCALWQAGATVCLHADAALARGREPHWACADQARWIRRWRADVRLAGSDVPPDTRPDLSFFAGHDLHSQLERMRSDLLDTGAGSTAVVLADSSLLMPVLHHLPDKNVNISMGYPLSRSPLFRLLDALFRLEESRTEDGRFHWRALLHVLRHPYLHMLSTEDAQARPLALRDAMRRLDALLRNGSRFADLTSLCAECEAALAPELAALLSRTVKTLVDALDGARTTADLARWLNGIRALLLECGGTVWSRFPLDAEALYRLERDCIPELAQNALADEPFPKSQLFGIARQLLEQSRIPFEADPLVGVQVLGMLETRLLHFEHVFIMDATDDVLPGNPAPDPLLPDALRFALGLPDARERAHVAAHTLFRLCAGAKDVHFFWQEGMGGSALFDGKKQRSRFIEQCIWEEEQAGGSLLVRGGPRLRTAHCPVRFSPPSPRAVERTPGLDAALRNFLRQPLSASRLDVYLDCPLRFAWQQLCGLRPQTEVNEGDDPAAVGTCIHETMRALYSPWLGKTVHRGDIRLADAERCFSQALEAADLRRTLPADACLMLEAAVPVRLRAYLEHQPDETFILALERSLTVNMELYGRQYTMAGILDRIDRRDGLLHVLDYKTGRLKLHDPELWEDSALFAEARAICADGGCGAAVQRLDDCFERLREQLPSIQLPVYVAMLRRQDFGPVGNAALVELRANGAEASLFSHFLEDDELEDARQACDTALALLLLHLETTPRFTPRPDRHCDWCAYASLCHS